MHVRLSRIEGGALGIGGVITTAPDLVALVWLQSRMVFFVAAAMGYDPNHPMRPAELLALQGVYETPPRPARVSTAWASRWPWPWCRPSSSRKQDERIAGG